MIDLHFEQSEPQNPSLQVIQAPVSWRQMSLLQLSGHSDNMAKRKFTIKFFLHKRKWILMIGKHTRKTKKIIMQEKNLLNLIIIGNFSITITKKIVSPDLNNLPYSPFLKGMFLLDQNPVFSENSHYNLHCISNLHYHSHSCYKIKAHSILFWENSQYSLHYTSNSLLNNSTRISSQKPMAHYKSQNCIIIFVMKLTNCSLWVWNSSHSSLSFLTCYELLITQITVVSIVINKGHLF